MAENQSIIDLMEKEPDADGARALRYRFHSEAEALKARDALEGLRSGIIDVADCVAETAPNNSKVYKVIVHKNSVAAIEALEKAADPESKKLINETRQTLLELQQGDSNALEDRNKALYQDAIRAIESGNAVDAVQKIKAIGDGKVKLSGYGWADDSLADLIWHSKFDNATKLSLFDEVKEAAQKTNDSYTIKSADLYKAQIAIQYGDGSKALKLINDNSSVVTVSEGLLSTVHTSTLPEGEKLALYTAIAEAAIKVGTAGNGMGGLNTAGIVGDIIQNNSLSGEHREELLRSIDNNLNHKNNATLKAEVGQALVQSAVAAGNTDAVMDIITKYPTSLNADLHYWRPISVIGYSEELNPEQKLKLYHSIADFAFTTNNQPALKELIESEIDNDTGRLELLNDIKNKALAEKEKTTDRKIDEPGIKYLADLVDKEKTLIVCKALEDRENQDTFTLTDKDLNNLLKAIQNDPAIIKQETFGREGPLLQMVANSDLDSKQKHLFYKEIANAAISQGNIETLTQMFRWNLFRDDEHKHDILEIKDKIASGKFTDEQKESLLNITGYATAKLAIKQGDVDTVLQQISDTPDIVTRTKIGHHIAASLTDAINDSKDLYNEDERLKLYKAIANAAANTGDTAAIDDLIRYRVLKEDKNKQALLDTIQLAVAESDNLSEEDKKKISGTIQLRRPQQPQPAAAVAAAVVAPPVVTPPAATPEPEPILARPATVLAQPEPVLAPPIGSMRAAGDILRSLDRYDDGVVDPSAITKGVAQIFLKAADIDGDNALNKEELGLALAASGLNVDDPRVSLHLGNKQITGMTAAIEVLGGALRKAGVTVLADTSDNSTFPDSGVRVFLEQSKQNGARGPR